MRYDRILLGLLPTALLIAAAPLRAGVVLRATTTDHGRSAPVARTSEVLVEGGDLRIDVEVGHGKPRMTLIYRGERREILVVDHSDRTYTVLDRAMVQAVTGQIDQALQQFQKQLEGMTPEQRTSMERLMGRQLRNLGSLGDEPPPPPASEVRESGERAERSGYPCTRREVWSEGRRIREFWVTDWDRIEGGGEVRTVLFDLVDFAEELLEPVRGRFPGFDFGELGNPFQDARELGGFPVVTRFLDGDRLTSETVVEAVERREFEDGTFLPPATYSAKDISLAAR